MKKNSDRSLFAAPAGLVTPSIPAAGTADDVFSQATESLQRQGRNQYVFYRASTVLPARPERAFLRFYATNLTEIAVNGRTVHQGPCRSAEPCLYYDELELELDAGEAFFCFLQNVDSAVGDFGILCELETIYAGRSCFHLQAADSYEAGFFEGYLRDVPLNSGTGFAEYYRLGAGESQWASRRFARSFPAARSTTATVGVGGWRKRPIPLFHEQETVPVKIEVEPDGALLADFGTMRFGRIELDAEPEEDGVVKVEYIEDLKGGWISPTGSCVMYDDRILDAAGPFHWKSFHKRACRYIRLRNVRPGSVKLRIQQYNYPVRDIGFFRSSDPMLNRLAEISTATLKVCMDDIYNDCPHRDQAQWMDAYASAQVALGLFGVRDLTRKCLIQYGCKLVSGRLLSPSLIGRASLPDYSMIFVSFVLWYYHATGDTGPAAELADNLDTMLRRFRRYARRDGLLENPVEAPDFIYLDNTFELAKEGKSAAMNALYCRALADYAELCRILGDGSRAAEYAALHAGVRDSYRKVFRHASEPGCFTDTDRRDDRGYRMINFSCELGHWSGGTGVLEFDLNSISGERKVLEYADYAGIRILLNGTPVLERVRTASWGRQPMYDPETVELSLMPGRNRIRFEVPSNLLNWELFFRFADGSEINPQNAALSECAPEDGRLITAPRPVRIREWVPPLLSQSTHAYAGFARIHDTPEENLAMLRRTLRKSYPRTYKSVRVPSFCPECGSAEREKEPWVMPTNTPWSTFFLLTALFDSGGRAEALEVIRSYWHDMVITDGAVTTYEEWGTRSSLCHAWGAAPVCFMQREILGVHHETLHTGRLLVRPWLGDLPFAEGRVALDASTGAAVTIRLQREENTTRLTLKAPADIAIELDMGLLENCRLSPDSEFTRADGDANSPGGVETPIDFNQNRGHES